MTDFNRRTDIDEKLISLEQKLSDVQERLDRHYEAGWNSAQLALDAKAENARELGLDYSQRTWVGLTDEDAEEVWRNVQTSDFHDCVQPFARAIEAKLKEKNT
jgi:hypothetical protein